jgi:hypothetical protein
VLLAALRKLGQDAQFAILVGRRPADQVSAASARGAEYLLSELADAGASAQVLALAVRVAADAALDQVGDVGTLLRAFAAVGATDALAVLSARAADQISFAHAWEVSLLLNAFRDLSLTPAIARLIPRDPAANIRFGDSRSDRHAWPTLLTALKSAEYEDQVTIMAARMATHADLSRAGTTAEWADAMREVGAHDQVLDLARRAADSGHFDLFLKIDQGAAEDFRYGREPDRTPSPPWTWSDLGAD